MNIQDKITARNRVKKLLKLAGKYADIKNPRTHILTNALCEHYNIVPIKNLEQLFTDPDSIMFKDKKLPVLPLTQKQYDKRYKKTKITKIKRHLSKKEIYNRYINSPEWRRFRTKVLKERGHKCEICKKEGNSFDIHHLTYERLGNELLEDVQVLCQSCHKEIHKKNKK